MRRFQPLNLTGIRSVFLQKCYAGAVATISISTGSGARPLVRFRMLFKVICQSASSREVMAIGIRCALV